jgi:adenosylcobinamide-phosphate synthase
MAAMALALGVSLGKPGVYTLNPEGRPPAAADTALAQGLAAKAVAALLVLSMAALLLAAVLAGLA